MKILKLHLINFKRFTDLQIGIIPETAKLVLLIGANGSGKSSVFDAFNLIDSYFKGIGGINEDDLKYYSKKNKDGFALEFTFDNQKQVKYAYPNFLKIDLNKTTFYGRTSFRQVSKFTRTALGQGGYFNLENDSDRSKLFIDKDNRFENDIEKITEIILNELFVSNTSSEEIKSKYIEPINQAFVNIFGNKNGTKLILTKIIPPLEGKIAQIIFQKGNSEIHYNYLSAGEKEVFNLLINLLSRSSLYQDTVYFLDEMDMHLNTKLQYNLLKEITENWIPENCQLWTASHSLGFIEYAKQADIATIIDFDDLDFDLPRILTPEPKDNPDIYEIAIGKEFLSSIFQQKRICFVENQDKYYYASIGLADTIFVSDNNRNNVYHKVRTSHYFGMVDRDFLSDEDVVEIKKQYPNLYILEYYSIENYLFHPDNLLEYYTAKNEPFDKETYITQLTEAKNQVKDNIIPTLALKRTEYPYFGEPEWNGKPLQNRFKNKEENAIQATIIASYLNNNDFETYYKVLPMKTYLTHLPQRQNIAKNNLAKTEWFKAKILEILNQ